MGILDDAIRQHLELKRRQGAGEDELARLEGEAFGPPARPGDPDFPETGESATSGPAEPQAEEPLAEPAPQATVMEAPPAGRDAVDAAGEGAALDDVAEAEAPPAPADQGEFFDQGGELDLDLELDDEFTELEADAPEESLAAPSEPAVSSLDTVEHPAPPPPGEDTVEHDVEGGGDEELVEGEDVLEETPEFLRDQPEDDELWFEQGEPKDFDF